MKQYEYTLVVLEITKGYVDLLNQYGRQGWQLVHAQADENGLSYFATFMREIIR